MTEYKGETPSTDDYLKVLDVFKISQSPDDSTSNSQLEHLKGRSQVTRRFMGINTVSSSLRKSFLFPPLEPEVKLLSRIFFPAIIRTIASGLSGLIPASLDYSKWLVRDNPCQFEPQKMACPGETLSDYFMKFRL